MIRTELEYREASKRLAEEKARLDQQEAKLREMKLAPDEIKRAMDPMRSFHMQLAEEIASYERLKRGEFDEVRNLQGLGNLLVGLRIARGVSQRELASRLGVHESQISRDERNEYRNVTLERAARILAALGVEARTTVELTGRYELQPV
ncbi:MAG: helix-turn-helix transcriptional regulator [Planctomycetes bacterium]|nr:helix-turn-helix transcriptional regulator [Planctomycetota bacterium]